MTGGTAGACVIGVNLLAALGAGLRGGSCRPLGLDVGVETVNGAVRYPDALIACTSFELQDKKGPDVVVVFDVVSARSGPIDRIAKVREYATVSSIRRYVILESSNVGLTVFERGHADETWRASALDNDDALRMPEVGIEIPVSEVCEDISFSDQNEASD